MIKTGRSTILFSVITVVLFTLFLPLMAVANPVTWTSESYQVGVFYEDQTGRGKEKSVYGTPPISTSLNLSYSPAANCSGGTLTYMTLESSLTDSSMNIYTEKTGKNCLGEVWNAGANITNTYTATNSYFELLYDYNRTSGSNSYALLWLQDVTSGATLFSQYLPANTTGQYLVPTVEGNNIQVYLALWGGYPNTTASLTYSMSAVAPEPISSLLFITGGTLLAGRRYIKRKKIA